MAERRSAAKAGHRPPSRPTPRQFPGHRGGSDATSDIVLDSSVLAKLVLPEPDSAISQRIADEVTSRGERLIVLDLAFPEVANAIWKRRRQRLLDDIEARRALTAVIRCPVQVEPAVRLLPAAFEISIRYDRAVYDALFVALAADLRLVGITADEPL